MTTPGSPAPRSSSARLALAAGAAGLVGGLALGATSLAGAASPTSHPLESTTSADQAAAAPAATPSEKAEPAPGQRAPRAQDGERRAGGGGLVTAITDTSLTLRTPSGPKTFALNSSTTYYQGKTAATRAAVAVGDVVRVRVVDPKATTPVAASVTVVPAHLEGWVTAIDGGTITVTDHDGFTRKIHTTGQTTVMKDGAASTLSAVTVGSFIRAMGEVANDGTTLDADRIALGAPARPAGGPGGGPGGRGGHPGGGPGDGPESDPANDPAGNQSPDPLSGDAPNA